MKTILPILAVLLAFNAQADELRLSQKEALQLGYRPVAQVKRDPVTLPVAKHSLPWPVIFQDAAHTIGNSMAQYQNYGGDAYWHGGDDLRTARKAWLTSPVSGTLYGGHYSYVDNADGSAVKHMLPWPQQGQAMYFEISITTTEGHRFEFHHVDRATLTPEVIALLNRGGGLFAAGTRIGQVIDWPIQKPSGQTYYHIHYNIITPDEKELNPEWYSVLVPDTTAPQLHGLYARYGQRVERVLENAKLTQRPDELIAANTDLKDGNSYLQPTDYFALTQNGKTTVLWDMRQRLVTPTGIYPDIRTHFQTSLRTADGTLRTQGNYSGDHFLMRLPLPTSNRGDVELVLKDQAGNTNNFRFSLP